MSRFRLYRFLPMLAFGAVSAFAAPATIENWAGEIFTGNLRLADGQFVVALPDGEKNVALADFFQARFDGAAGEVGDDKKALFYFADGSRLAAPLPAGNLRETVKLARESQTWEFPLAQLQAIVIGPLAEGAAPETAPASSHLVMRNGKILPGEIEWFTALQVGVKTASGRLRLDLDKVHRVVFFAAKNAAPPLDFFRVLAASGDIVMGKLTRLDDEKIALAGAASNWEFPVGEILTMESCSDRAVSLLALTPKITKIPFIDFIREPTFDRGLTGGDLLIGSRAFARGIATHSRTELAYNLDGKFTRLVAEVGIDSTLGNHGDAIILINAGAKTLARAEITGAGSGESLSVDVAGVKTLTLIADFGKNGSSGDHIVWGNPRLIKAMEK